jgi:hypothetical protein
MDTIIRAAAIYAFLFIVFRISGKRSLSDITTFDFVLLLIIAETTQQALIGDDFSIITAVVLISTLFVIEISLTLLKQRSPSLDKFLEGEPVVLVENGRPLKERMDLERIDPGRYSRSGAALARARADRSNQVRRLGAGREHYRHSSDRSADERVGNICALAHTLGI